MDTLADKFLHNCFDVQIHTEDGILTAHRIVLGAVSPFLHAVMTAASSDSDANISLPVKTEKLSLLLEFLYKGNIKVSFVKLC